MIQEQRTLKEVREQTLRMDILERNILEKCNSNFKSSEQESYGVFKHSKVGGMAGMEPGERRGDDAVSQGEGGRFSMYGMES